VVNRPETAPAPHGRCEVYDFNFALPKRIVAMLICDAVQKGNAMREIPPQPEDRANDPEWQANFAALKERLRSKRGSGYGVGIITEDDKYDNDALDGLRRF
jgi:hypothetical protein